MLFMFTDYVRNLVATSQGLQCKAKHNKIEPKRVEAVLFVSAANKHYKRSVDSMRNKKGNKGSVGVIVVHIIQD